MKEFLICIDSDGCAIDSMDIKHKKCFAPCMIKEWSLEKWEKDISEQWNTVNLYSATRGINRFLALNTVLSEVNEKYVKIDGIDIFSRWCKNTAVFSNAAVEKEINNGAIFSKVLTWSDKVNSEIEKISPLIRPFDGVKTAIAELSEKADIAIVSSANPKAVEDEWTRFGLMEHITYVMAQDKGTKADCIKYLLSMGYDPNKTLMAGDAYGDKKAAFVNEVSFFPIIVKNETASWELLKTEGGKKLFNGTFNGEYQQKLIENFEKAFN